MQGRIIGVVILLLTTCFINAQDTVIAVEGSNDVGLTILGPPGPGDLTGMISWTQANTVLGVSISATLEGPVGAPDSTATMTAYLTTRSGPNTTVASEVARFTFLPAAGPDFNDITLFSGLILGPGTYYLTIAGDLGFSGAWGSSLNPTVTTAPGVTNNGSFRSFGNDAYPPSDGFSPLPDGSFLFRVTATGVPEPSTAEMLLLGGAASVLAIRRRR